MLKTTSVFDFELQRTSLFRTDGTFLASYSPKIASPVSSIHIDPSGRKIIISLSRSDFLQAPETGDIIDQRSAFILGTDGDTVATITTPAIVTGRRIGADRLRITKYFSGRPAIVYVPAKGLLVSGGCDPMLEWYNLEGELVKRIEIDWEPEPVSQEIREEILKRLRESVQNARTPRTKDQAKRRLDNVDIQNYRDFSTFVYVDESGHFWLQRPDYFSPESDRLPVFRVLSPEGEYLGETIRPHQFGMISHGHFLATLMSEEPAGNVTFYRSEMFIAYQILPAVEELIYP